MRRVVITGLGTISSLGHDHRVFWDALCHGQTGVATITQVDCEQLRFKQGAEVKHFSSETYFDLKQIHFLDRFTQFALIAAKEAAKDAHLTTAELANSRTAVITGSCVGGKITEDREFFRLYHERSPRLHPTCIPNAMANAGASQIASTFGIMGPAYTFSTACSSSTHAIGHAFWLIRSGLVERAITGGSEAPFSLGHLKAWEAMRIVSKDSCRPFSMHRQGLILGEGGAMLVLESLDSAKARGATIYAEIVGFGMSADAGHMTDPHSKGQEQAIRAALQDGNLRPEAIHHINAHGTGTQTNDKVETETIHAVFQNHVSSLRINSTKPAHGHLLGATGAIETIATTLTLKHGIIPPTLNYLGKDPACDLPLVVGEAQHASMEFALCSSFAFGGLNAILALRAY